MAKTPDIAGVSASRLAAVAAVLLVSLVNSSCSTSGPSGQPAPDGTGLVEGALISDRDKIIADMFAIERPGVDGIETGTIEPAAIETGPTEPARGAASVFGSVAIPIRNFPVSARWARVDREIEECAVVKLCGDADGLLWRIASATAGKPTARKLEIVNSMVNSAIRYRSDLALYGKRDYWAGPGETLSRASGDCEDFVILKMTALIRAGVPAESLSLVVLRDNSRGVFHAVLAAATSSGNLILDNTRTEVVPDADLRDYQPLYSFSGARAWVHGTRTHKGPTLARDGDLSSIAPGEGIEAGRGSNPARGVSVPET
jgi:predicted transglutaminase-like cysteine proteinase